MATIETGLDRGRSADTPSEMPWEGWKDILWRTYAEFDRPRVRARLAGTARTCMEFAARAPRRGPEG